MEPARIPTGVVQIPPFMDSLRQHNNIDLADWPNMYEFLKKFKNYEDPEVKLFIRDTLVNAMCVVRDDSGMKHNCVITFMPPNKMVITSTSLPRASFEDAEYTDLREIINTFKLYANSLIRYCSQLNRIDKICAVVEPVEPTFQWNTRIIMLDMETYMHVTVMLDGRVTGIHISGTNTKFQQQMQDSLPRWEPNMDFVDNFTSIFSADDLEYARQMLGEFRTRRVRFVAPVCMICEPNELVAGGFFHANCLVQLPKSPTVRIEMPPVPGTWAYHHSITQMIVIMYLLAVVYLFGI